MEDVRIKKEIFDYIYIGMFVVLIFLFATGNFAKVTGTSLVVIDNSDPNSMFPTYFQGDLFVIKDTPANSLEIGDVVVYEDHDKDRIIHRIIDIFVDENGDYFFRIKGDDPITNKTPDAWEGGYLIPYEQVLGKIVARIPFIGHISLAMQNSPSIRILLYFFAIITAIAIIFLPDEEEEEEEDKYYNITKEAFQNLKKGISNLRKKVHGALFTSRYKTVNSILAVSLLVVLILPIFTPLLLPQKYDYNQIGVKEVEIGNPLIMNEFNVNQVSDVFINLNVQIYDQSSNFKKVTGYTLTYYDGDSLLGETRWNTIRKIKGTFVVGGSLIIHESDHSTMSNNTVITISITLHLKTFIFHQDLEPYVTTFLFNPPTFT